MLHAACACTREQNGERIGTNTSMCSILEPFIVVSVYSVTVFTYTVRSLCFVQMSIYVFFPVAVFYYFNIPEFYENYVAEKRVSCDYEPFIHDLFIACLQYSKYFTFLSCRKCFIQEEM